MFETIFTWRRTIARHERGPMAEERRRYLRHLKERGLSRESLHFMRCMHSASCAG